MYAHQDATIAAVYAQLAAQALGRGSAWVDAFQDESVSAAIDATGSLEPVALLPLGYPAAQPEHSSRRPIGELVRLEREQGAEWASDGFGFSDAHALEGGPFAPAILTDHRAEPVCLGESVIVTAADVSAARRFLKRFGLVERTAFHSVLIVKVSEVASFLEQMRAAFQQHPEDRELLGRVLPLQSRIKHTDKSSRCSASPRICRHQSLVGFFGERIERCGTSCEHCTGQSLLDSVIAQAKQLRKR